MSFDSCPMDGFDFEKVGERLQLPDDHLVAMLVAIGKGVAPAAPRGGQLSWVDVVITDRF